jgi:hypothetical protein
MVIIMKFRILKNDAWVKKFVQIVPGTSYGSERDPEVLGEYETLEEAVKEFEKFPNSLISEESGMFKLTEFILEHEYDDDYVDTERVTEPYIELVNSDDYSIIETFRDCKAAKDAEDKAIEQGLNVYLSYR